MIMKKLYIYIIAVITFSGVHAQQEGHFTQFFQNKYLFNPAVTGTQQVMDFSMGYRNQWLGMDNNPQTPYVLGHSEIKVKRNQKSMPMFNESGETWFKTPEVETGFTKHTVGGKFLADQYGAFGKLTAMASYAIHLPMNKFTNLSFGIGAGLSSLQFYPERVNMLEDNDNTYMQYMGNGGRQNYLDMQTGLYLYNKSYFLGYSITNLLMNKVGFGDNMTESKLNMHHYFTGGYHIELNKEYTVTPMFLMKYMRPAPVSFDLAVKVDYNDFVWGALSYRHQDAIALMAGFNFSKMFRFSYSYDINVTPLRKYHTGTHEIIVGIFLGGKKDKDDKE